MASPEPLDGGQRSDHPDVLGRPPSALHVRKSGGSAGGGGGGGGGGPPEEELSRDPAQRLHERCHSAPRTAPRKGGADVKLVHLGEEKVRVCRDEELETSFTCIDENVNLRLASPDTGRKGAHGPGPCSESLPELSFLSEDELSFGEGPGSSTDYGFISAVTFLVTGISLVIISYAVPRDVRVDRDSVSAREMERLERESARIGAHLDRCVIAGLCLLTLGGVVLSTLLMVSMWKGEMYRRKVVAYSRRSAKQYGSITLKTRSSPSHSSAHLTLEEATEETLT